MDHNHTRNVRSAITIDTHDYDNVDIFRNRFYDCGNTGILFNGGGIYRDIKIHDNLFVMAESCNGPSLLTGSARVTTKIYRNTVLRRDPTIPLLSRGARTSAVLRDNVVRKRTAKE